MSRTGDWIRKTWVNIKEVEPSLIVMLCMLAGLIIYLLIECI